MKAIFTLLFLLSVSFVQAQDFAPTGATWHYSAFPVGPGPYQEYFIKFEVTGDTTINGQTCSIIHKDEKVQCLNRPDDEFVYISNDTVFVFDPAFSQFRMLYDFNANAGDSWEIMVVGANYATDVDTNIITVDSTDFVSINGQNLKRQYVTYLYNNDGIYWEYNSTIIERIGDTKYMFNYYTDNLSFCDINHSGGLRCYEDSVVGFYETGIADSCEYMEPYSSLVEIEASNFTILPNPVHDILEIRMENETPERIRILDSQGRLLLNTYEASISVSTFKSGVYLVQVLANGSWSQRRFVKH